jgi:hypothetical protein
MSIDTPTWVRRLADEHTVLHRLAQQMEYMVTSPDESTRHIVLPVLEEISARCRAQQVYDEDDQFLPSLKTDHPELADRLAQFSSERTNLQSEIVELLAEVQSQSRAENLKKNLVPRIQQWLVRVDLHQRRVDSVLDEAFGTAR